MALVGLPGTGKSTVAPMLAGELGVRWVDLDDEVEHRYNTSISELFGTVGESGFRERELAVLGDVLDGSTGVVATGGGLVTIHDARRLLERCEVVWLRATIGTLLGRLSSSQGSPGVRPLLVTDGERGLRGRLEELSEQRNDLYCDVADLILDVDDHSPTAVVHEILEYFAASPERGELRGT